MGNAKWKFGHFYESVNKVRKYFGEYRKGILVKGNEIAIIMDVPGARRRHYSNRFEVKNGQISYVGEGLKGDQSHTKGNAALCESFFNGQLISVFFDCGDLLSPKHLVCAGLWVVSEMTYRYEKPEGRKVYRFLLQPAVGSVLIGFKHMFSSNSPDFEKELTDFARVREKLYSDFSHILRSRDSIAGEIGEYFAILHYERYYRTRLVRVQNAFKDIDAVEVGSGKRIAIKTVSAEGKTTSNIWSKDISSAVDKFVIVVLNRHSLVPESIYSITTSKIAKLSLLKIDSTQKSLKLTLNSEFKKYARKIL